MKTLSIIVPCYYEEERLPLNNGKHRLAGGLPFFGEAIDVYRNTIR